MSARPCGNCGRDDWYAQEVPGGGRHGPNLFPGPGERIFGPLRKVVEIEIGVCGNCGLIEWFVPKRFLSDVKNSRAKTPEPTPS